MTNRGWILFLSLSVIWGIPYLLIRVDVQEVDPLVVAEEWAALHPDLTLRAGQQDSMP